MPRYHTTGTRARQWSSDCGRSGDPDEFRTGHGADKPTWMRIEELADEWASPTRALDMQS